MSKTPVLSPPNKNKSPEVIVISAAQNSKQAAQNSAESIAQNFKPIAQNSEPIAQSHKSAAQNLESLTALVSSSPVQPVDAATAAPVTESDQSAVTLEVPTAEQQARARVAAQIDRKRTLTEKHEAAKKLKVEQQEAKNAQAANRICELQKAIRDLELHIATLRASITELNADVKSTDDSTLASRVRADNAAEDLKRIESAQGATQQELQSSQENAELCKAEHARLQTSIATCTAEVAAAQRALATFTSDHEDTIAQSEVEIAKLEGEIALETDDDTRAEKLELLEAERAIIRESESGTTGLKTNVSDLEAKLEAERKVVAHASEKLDESSTRVAELQTSLSSLTAQRGTAKTELQAADAELTACTERATLLLGEVLAKQGELAALVHEVEEANAELAELAKISDAKVELTTANADTAKQPEPHAPQTQALAFVTPKQTEVSAAANPAPQRVADEEEPETDYTIDPFQLELLRLRALAARVDPFEALCHQTSNGACAFTLEELSEGLKNVFGPIGETALKCALSDETPETGGAVKLLEGGRSKAYIFTADDGNRFVIRSSAWTSRADAHQLQKRLKRIYAELNQRTCMPVVLQSKNQASKFVVLTVSPFFGDTMSNVLKSNPSLLSGILPHIRVYLSNPSSIVHVDCTGRNLIVDPITGGVIPIDFDEACFHPALASVNWFFLALMLLFSGSLTPHFLRAVLQQLLFEPMAAIFNDDAVNGNKLVLEQSNDGPLVNALAKIIAPKLNEALDDAVNDPALRTSLHDLIFFFLTYMAEATDPNRATSSTSYHFGEYFRILNEQVTEKVVVEKKKGGKRTERKVKQGITKNLAPDSTLFLPGKAHRRSDVADKYTRLLLHITFALSKDAPEYCRRYENSSRAEKDKWYNVPPCESHEMMSYAAHKQAGISLRKLGNSSACDNFIKALTNVSCSVKF